MNLDNLNKWLALAANIGVIAGIVFLAVEIDQFRDQMESQNNFNYFTALSANLVSVSENPFLAGTIAKIFTEDALTPSEEVSANNFIMSIFLFWEYVWRETEAGRFDENQRGLNAIAMDFNSYKNEPWGKKFMDRWENSKKQLEPGLVEYLENNSMNQ